MKHAAFLLPLFCATALASPQNALRVAHGDYLQFVPDTEPTQLLVLVHGALSDADDGGAAAQRIMDRFAPVAAQHAWMVVAPIFDNVNFGSFEGPGGGYRALFGREVGADIFIDEVVAAALKAHKGLPSRHLFYGHSAGGQCVLRYLVRHPEHVAAVVATSAGTFAFPDTNVPWPDGSRPMRARIPWPGLKEAPIITVRPDPQTFLDATQVPTAVLVGSDDDMPVPEEAGQHSETRLGRASAWVDAMNSHAKASGKTGKARFVAVPGKHMSAEMHEKAVRYLVRP